MDRLPIGDLETLISMCCLNTGDLETTKMNSSFVGVFLQHYFIVSSQLGMILTLETKTFVVVYLALKLFGVGVLKPICRGFE